MTIIKQPKTNNSLKSEVFLS